MHITKGERGRGKERNANIANGERRTEENEIDPAQEWNEADPELLGDYWDVNYTGSGDESLSDLDSEEVKNYGGDSEVELFLQNNEETQGNGGCEAQRALAFSGFSPRGGILRERKGKRREILANSTRN